MPISLRPLDFGPLTGFPSLDGSPATPPGGEPPGGNLPSIRRAGQMVSAQTAPGAGGPPNKPPVLGTSAPMAEPPGGGGAGGGSRALTLRQPAPTGGSMPPKFMGPAQVVSPERLPAPVATPAAPAAGAGPKIPDMSLGRQLDAQARGSRAARYLNGGLGRTVGLGTALVAGSEASDAAERGDWLGAADAGLRAGAGTLAAIGNPVLSAAGGAYLAGHGLGTTVNKAFIEPNRDLSDAIGGTINQGVRSLGQAFGKDWGVDDSAYLAQRANERLNPQPTAATAATARTGELAGPPEDAMQPVLRGTDLGNGIRRVDAPGSAPLFTNAKTNAEDDPFLKKGGGFVGTVPHYDAEANAKGVAAEREVQLMKMGLRDRGDIHAYTTGNGPAADEEARLSAAVAGSSIGNLADNRAALRDFRQRRMEQMRLDAELQRTGTSNRAAYARLAYDMGKDQRDYGLREREFSQKQEEQAVKTRQDSAKAFDDRVAGLLPPGPDGKPDAQATSRARLLANNMISQRTTDLQRHLQLHPEDANAAAELANINERGYAALDSNSVERVVAGLKAEQQAHEYGTSALNPIGGTDVMTDQPITSLRYNPGLLGTGLGATYTANTGAVLPKRAVDGGNIVGLGVRRTDMDSLKVRGDK